MIIQNLKALANAGAVITLFLALGCGKESPGSKAKSKTMKAAVAPVVEMVNARCVDDHDCTEECTASFVSCVDPCGGQNVTHQQFQQNPSWKTCQDACQATVNACYGKQIQISKEAFEKLQGIEN